MMNFVYIAFGGALGAAFRYGIAGIVQNMIPGSFPWGTLCVNTIGSLVIGLFWGLSELTYVPSAVRLLFAVGFLGSFTTFSTFSLETFNLLRDRETLLGLMNIGLNNLLAILFVFAGYFLSRYPYSMLK